ncbi:MAG: hypothetical protein HYY18_09155 [Planctomycetes bacterium]|nr:hypothetical protein [Planctomycetota bacterium]
MALGALALVAFMFQMEWNRRRMAKDVEKSNEEWKRKQEAVKATPPGTGQVEPGAEVLWDNMLAGERDDAPLDDLQSDKGYKYLIRHLANLKPGEGLGHSIPFDYAELLKNPNKWRGKVVSLSGLTNKIQSNIRLESNQGHYDAVYRLYLVDLSGTEGFILDVLDRPDGVERRDPVEAEGIFLRTHKYLTEKGQEVRVPVFVARSVREVSRGTVHRTWSTEMTVGVVTVSVMLVLVITIAGISGRKKPKTSQSP